MTTAAIFFTVLISIAVVFAVVCAVIALTRNPIHETIKMRATGAAARDRHYGLTKYYYHNYSVNPKYAAIYDKAYNSAIQGYI
jgi:hypothetical protein